MNTSNIDSAAKRASAEGNLSSNYRDSRHHNNNRDNRSSYPNNQSGNKDLWATAPYNFIPYDPEYIVKAVQRGKQLYSGVIDCELETLTPLIVGDTSRKKEKGEPSVKEFFSVDGKLLIPATSIKGMIRNYIEILSCSLLSPVTDEKIFYRSFVNKIYKEKFGINQKIKGGFLKKSGPNDEL